MAEREKSRSFAGGRSPEGFFLGEQPTEIGATPYGFLVHQLWVPWHNPAKQGQSLKNLESYCDRMKQDLE